MTPDEIDLAISELETRLERLRALYEQYFMGIERMEPAVVRKDVDRRFYVLRKEKIRNTAKRFKMQTLVQRYNTMQQYWSRICREIELGTYKRHKLRAERTFAALDAQQEARSTAASDLPPDAEAPEQETAADRATRAKRSVEDDLRELLASDSGADAELDAAMDALFSPEKPKEAAPAPAKRGGLLSQLGAARAPGGAEPKSAQPSSAQAPSAPAPSTAPRPSTPLSGPASSAPRPSAPLSSGAATSAPAPSTAPRPSAPLSSGAATSAPAPSTAPRTTPSTVPRPGAASVPRPAPSSAPPRPALRSGPPQPPPRPSATPSRPPAPPPPRPSGPVPAGAPAASRPPLPPPRSMPPAAPRPPAAAAAPPAARPAAPAQAKPAPATSALDDARLRELHQRYQAAREQTKSSPVSLEKLAQNLRETEAKLRAQHQGRRIDFDVVVKDGKAVIKPKLT